MGPRDVSSGFGAGRRPRILVALEPAMLADAMASLLEGAGQDDVEVLGAGESPEGHYDGAIVTIDLTDLDATVVVHLPDSGGGAGVGTATAAGHTHHIELVDVRSVFGILDEHCATGVSRSSRLSDL